MKKKMKNLKKSRHIHCFPPSLPPLPSPLPSLHTHGRKAREVGKRRIESNNHRRIPHLCTSEKVKNKWYLEMEKKKEEKNRTLTPNTH